MQNSGLEMVAGLTRPLKVAPKIVDPISLNENLP